MDSIHGGGEWVMVVEYLETSMSKHLLGKFPDNSAYDFDYSQSSIWSPLVNRGLVSSSSTCSSINGGTSNFGLSRKLAYDEEDINIMMGLTKIKKFSAKIKRKLTDTLFYNLQKYQKMKRVMKKKKKKSLDLSPVPIPSSNRLNSTSVTPRKGWEKVLKAATKHFKKKKNKRRDSVGLFPSCLTEEEDLA